MALSNVLTRYRIPTATIERAGGTAGSTWRVVSHCGHAYFIRRRGARTSSPERIRFDHGLRCRLAAHGFPTVAPLKTDTGETWIAIDGAAYETYPFVDGLVYSERIAPSARASTARVLAQLHRVSAGYDGLCETLVPQFSSYPEPVVPRERFDAPDAHIEALDMIERRYATPAERSAIAQARARIVDVGRAYAAVYSDLPRTVIHGDYNCFNLLFTADGHVVGVFDFDWAWREVRVFDVAQGMFFFGAHRTGDLDPASIWSLTRCPDLDTGAMAEFARAYHRENALTDLEWCVLPLVILARWVSWRLEGAMKVPERRRVEFLLYGFQQPFAWYDTADWPPNP